MIDCHSHLTDNVFDDNIENILNEAHHAGISDVICVSTSMDDIQAVMKICSQSAESTSNNNIHCGLGIHPEYADIAQTSEAMEYIQQNSANVVCVGEVGLDFRPHIIGKSGTPGCEEAKEIQREVFRIQIQKAIELDLPLNVHSCAAGHHAIALLQELGATKVVMHAFDGKAHYAEAASQQSGFYFSVPPCVVRSPQLQKMVRRLPLDSLLLESDSPALPPVQGDINTPANIVVSCEQIAALKNIPIEEVATITYQNSLRLFNKIPSNSIQETINGCASCT
mmetsp:Transcript_10840/g.14088  ORF Transcript_10840/g.14088 Transcript_10840/m.14088 type:complete len:281 (-) Transcript_10840:55-897(-)